MGLDEAITAIETNLNKGNVSIYFAVLNQIRSTQVRVKKGEGELPEWASDSSPWPSRSVSDRGIHRCRPSVDSDLNSDE